MQIIKIKKSKTVSSTSFQKISALTRIIQHIMSEMNKTFEAQGIRSLIWPTEDYFVSKYFVVKASSVCFFNMHWFCKIRLLYVSIFCASE